MSQHEFDREIPPDEQLQEVSLILMEALFRVHRYGAPPRPPRSAAPPPDSIPAAGSGLPYRRRTLPKTRHAKYKPGTYANRLKNLFKKRKPQKARFWLDHVVSLQNAPRDQLNRAVCHTHQATLDLEFREAFDHAMRTLSPEERRIAGVVAAHGMTQAARETGLSWRQIANSLAGMRAVFEMAGFDPLECPDPAPRHSLMPRAGRST